MRDRPPTSWFALRLALAGCCAAATGMVSAQEPSLQPSFEVVSIRPGSGRQTDLGNGFRVLGAIQGGPGSSDPERLSGNSVSIKSLVLRAYGVKNYQVRGPAWIDDARYDIQAKVPAGVSRNQLDLIFQRMLQERFHLRMHLRDSVSADVCAAGARPLPGRCPEGVPYQAGMRAAAGSGKPLLMVAPQGSGRILTGMAVPISQLASVLEGQLGGTVVTDRTGLGGVYDLRLEFVSPTAIGQDETRFPSLFTAVEKTLGLKAGAHPDSAG